MTDVDVVREMAVAHGLEWNASRQAAAAPAFARARERMGSRDDDSFRRLLEESEAARNALLHEITVGETYFFREPAQLDFIRQRILPDLAASRPPDHRLRVWSAGCASGEEPYSLAILFHEAGLGGRVSILGTDVSRERLAAARRGHFSSWALRATSPRVQAAYFRAQGRQFVLRPEIRAMVEFAVLNLAEPEWPPASSGFDLVLCRNVLIYFDAEATRRVAGRLASALAEGGWLCLGSSDPPTWDLVPWPAFPSGGGLAHRRGPRPAARAPMPPEAPPPPAIWEEPPAPPLPVAERAPAAVVIAAPPAAEQPLRRSRPGEVRRLLHEGRRSEADALCARALEEEPLDAELHHIHALLLSDLGRMQDAVSAARRAVCLEPGFVMAHLALGLLLQRSGQPGPARRALAHASRLLAAAPPGQTPVGGDGETAGALLALVRGELARMRDDPPGRTA